MAAFSLTFNIAGYEFAMAGGKADVEPELTHIALGSDTERLVFGFVADEEEADEED